MHLTYTNLFRPHDNLGRSYFSYLHFTDEENEAQRGSAIGSRSHSLYVAELESESQAAGCRALALNH